MEILQNGNVFCYMLPLTSYWEGTSNPNIVPMEMVLSKEECLQYQRVSECLKPDYLII